MLEFIHLVALEKFLAFIIGFEDDEFSGDFDFVMVFEDELGMLIFLESDDGVSSIDD